MSGRFLRAPSYWMVPDGSGHWISDGYLDFQSERLGCIISVHPFSLNNLSSVPWFSRNLINPNGPHRPAAALHDELYALGGVTQGRKLTRKECDLLYLDAMLSDKLAYFDALPKDAQAAIRKHGLNKNFTYRAEMTEKWMAYILYAGVRLFGWIYWLKNGK